jgi:hypothetical protein
MLAAMIKQCCLAGSQGDVRRSYNYEHSTLQSIRGLPNDSYVELASHDRGEQ